MVESVLSGDAAPASGHLTAIHGSVIDARFERGGLPLLGEGIVVDPTSAAPLVAEVQEHLDLATVRAVALGNTAGLQRGVGVRAMGSPIRVPVGDAVLGRLLDPVGRPADPGPDLPADTPYRPIHAPAPSLDRLGSAQ